MRRILVTGATGNIGKEVIHYLCELDQKAEIIAGVRNVDSARAGLSLYPSLAFRKFDLEDRGSFTSAFTNIDILFLLRPPHISKIDQYFKPLLESARRQGIKNIVFLSVQGVENSKIIPHNKIERLIKLYGFNYIFVRPGYFMQNLTTTLLPEILRERTITLPAGDAKFNWIDTKNIGEFAASLILSFDDYQNSALDITGLENRNFPHIVKIMSEVTGKRFNYKSISPIGFYFKKRKEGLNSSFAIVMTILHFLPRFQKVPEISNNYKLITGKDPTTLKEFMNREKCKLSGQFGIQDNVRTTRKKFKQD